MELPDKPSREGIRALEMLDLEAKDPLRRLRHSGELRFRPLPNWEEQGNFLSLTQWKITSYRPGSTVPSNLTK